MKTDPEFAPRSGSARKPCEQESSRSGASRRSARRRCPSCKGAAYVTTCSGGWKCQTECKTCEGTGARNDELNGTGEGRA